MKRAFALLLLCCLPLLAGCAGTKEWAQTRSNRQAINDNIPVPEVNWSSRRYTLATFYGKILTKPRLRTCTMFSSRGGNTTGEDLLGVAETLGMPVNLSNQMTEPMMAEPDSLYTGSNDQTVVVFRNGLALVTEADTSTITGDCPPGVKPETLFQEMIDYQSVQEADESVNFSPTDEELEDAGIKQ